MPSFQLERKLHSPKQQLHDCKHAASVLWRLHARAAKNAAEKTPQKRGNAGPAGFDQALPGDALLRGFLKPPRS